MNNQIIDEIKNKITDTTIKQIQNSLKEKISTTNSNGVIFGLSGGIDSAVLAYICGDVLKSLFIDSL